MQLAVLVQEEDITKEDASSRQLEVDRVTQY
jgi:hypothetical protein